MLCSSVEWSNHVCSPSLTYRQRATNAARRSWKWLLPDNKIGICLALPQKRKLLSLSSTCCMSSRTGKRVRGWEHKASPCEGQSQFFLSAHIPVALMCTVIAFLRRCTPHHVGSPTPSEQETFSLKLRSEWMAEGSGNGLHCFIKFPLWKSFRSLQ